MNRQPASRQSAFYWRENPGSITWAQEQHNAAAKERTTKVVEKRRAAGDQPALTVKPLRLA